MPDLGTCNSPFYEKNLQAAHMSLYIEETRILQYVGQKSDLTTIFTNSLSSEAGIKKFLKSILKIILKMRLTEICISNILTNAFLKTQKILYLVQIG